METQPHFWQVEVDHEAHVGLIDAHAEGDDGDDDLHIIAMKAS